jgi:hypothetical protein
LTKRLLFLSLLLSTPLFAQSVGCGGVPGAVAQTPRNGCGGVPGEAAVPSLPLRWKMNEGSGLTFISSPTGDNITASNISWGTAIGVTSPTFNGTNSGGVAANDTLTNFDGTEPFSVSFWINTSVSATSALVSTIVPSSNFQGWEVQLAATGQIYFYSINDFSAPNYLGVNTSSIITLGQTTSVIVTYDGSREIAGVSVYLNGALSSLVTGSNTLTASAASGVPVYVGSRSDGSVPYSGSIGDLQIFGSVLDQTQVNAIVSAGPQ